MAKKSKLLRELGECVKNYGVENLNVNEFDIVVLHELNKKFLLLSDDRHSSYDLHMLNEIVMIVFLALLSECDEWTQIEMFAKQHYDWLKTFLPLRWGLPSVSTIMRVMALVKPEELETICVEFILERIVPFEKKAHLKNERDVKTMDGKSANDSGRKTSKDGEIKKMQAMSIYSNKYDMCLATEFIEDKTNEIPTGPKLLSKVNLENSIVTFDALNTQEDTIKYISENGGDYVAAVKGNQGTLYQDLIDYFEMKEVIEEIEQNNFIKNTEKAHSQIETRKYYLTSDIQWLSKKSKWNKLLSIGMVEKKIEKDGEIKIERRYYITSLSENEIEDFARAVREEWAIENDLHWHLDITFKEDKSKIAQKQAQQNLNILRKFCLNIIKIAQPSYKLSLKNIRKKLCMNFEEEFPYFISVLNIDKILNLVKPH